RTKIRHGEADVIHRAASRAGGRRRRVEEDQDVREPHDLPRADFHDRAAERVDEELLLGVDVRRVQVVMTVDDGSILRSEQLSRCLGCRGQGQQGENEHSEKSVHGDLFVGYSSAPRSSAMWRSWPTMILALLAVSAVLAFEKGAAAIQSPAAPAGTANKLIVYG